MRGGIEIRVHPASCSCSRSLALSVLRLALVVGFGLALGAVLGLAAGIYALNWLGLLP